MSFFENLAIIMGGEDQISPEFRTAFSAFATPTAPPIAAIEPSAPPIAEQAPVMPAEIANMRGDFFGFGGISGYGGVSGFTPPPEGVVTTGAPAPSGLYGGNVQYAPPSSAYSGINPTSYLSNKKEGASNLNAAVQRAQYQDYLNRFAPIENFAVGQIRGRNTADLGFDLARANQSVMNAGANLQGQQERAMGRFGLQYTGNNIAQSNEITGGRVAALNNARMADEQRAINMVAGGGQ